MYLKQITHDLKSKLSADHNISIKNSHIYELIASWNGYKSKASMNTSGVFFLNELGYSEENKEPDLFFSRGNSFGYSTLELTLLNNEITKSLNKFNLIFISYDELTLDYFLDDYEYVKSDYVQLLNTFETYKDHLISAVNRGSSIAAITLARFYEDLEEVHEIDDQTLDWYMVAAELGSIEAKSIVAFSGDSPQFLVEAAEHGDKPCIDKIARQENSPEKIHYWNEVAELYGHDITSNEAISDGGNWYVGHEGIELPVISEQAKNEAKQRAKTTFDKYSEEDGY